METKSYKLEEIAHNFYYGSMPKEELICNSGYPIFSGYRYTGFYPEYNVSTRSLVVIARGVGGTGDVRIAEAKTFLTNLSIAIDIDKKIADIDFLKYYMNIQGLRYLDSGAAQSQITINSLKKHRVFLPDIETQKQIVTVLSNYDNLIEVNNKRIKALEQMAENLYKEWFIRFRFPGHETAEFENGIPKGWEYKRFADVFICDRGVSYLSDEIECDEGENLINLKNIQGYGGFRRDGTKKYNGQHKSEQVVKYKDLVMGVTDMTQDRRTVGAVALIPNIKGVISADLIKLSSPIDNVFSYCLFRWGLYSTYISQFGNGANVIHLKPTSISNIKILIPKDETINSFSALVNPIMDQIENLNTEIEILIKQRDLLLPRLMSGKLEV